MAEPTYPTYKVKLGSGRVLGPLTLERVRKLIHKNQIIGTELAREYPNGEWKNINLIIPIAELLIAKLDGGKLLPKGSGQARPAAPDVTNVVAAPVLPGATVVLSRPLRVSEFPPTPQAPQAGNNGNTALQNVVALAKDLADEHAPEDARPATQLSAVVPQESLQLSVEGTLARKPEPEVEPTLIERPADVSDASRTRIESDDDAPVLMDEVDLSQLMRRQPLSLPARISEQATLLFERSGLPSVVMGSQGSKSFFKRARPIIVAIAVLFAAHDLLFDEPAKSKGGTVLGPIRPSLPAAVPGGINPARSAKLYGEAMAEYVKDHVMGYRQASEKLKLAAALDPSNAKALAMLASTYLNLIDSSNKDADYFAVISKIIDLTRAKNVDLPETVIADVEFFLTVNKAEAAQNKIVDYTRGGREISLEMFYYLALTFYHRGDYVSSARYLARYPDNRALSAKVFYLRGQLAEKIGDVPEAIREYEKAIKFNGAHARSRLKVAELLNGQGKLREAEKQLTYLMGHRNLLSPKDLSRAYYLHGLFEVLNQRYDYALTDLERAVRLDRENHTYLLELYTLRARQGAAVKDMQTDARMYAALGEGERFLSQGDHHRALSSFLLARQANDRSPLPLIKIGDMFKYQNDLGNARLNYRLAADRAPQNIDVWSKYIYVLIQSYEWEEAKAAMDRFRALPVGQSAIDKAAADLYAKQNQHVQAQFHYKAAMARDSIDSDVYIAYANSLMASKNYREAPFFFALALRFDPLNIEALIGTARCIAATESIDRGISLLQDEAQRSTGTRAEFLSAIAELQIQKGDIEGAQRNITQAIETNPDLGTPWKLQAQIHLLRQSERKDAVDKALAAFQSYSERNSSDPAGYIERYRIYVGRTQYEKANEELNRVFGIYPRYPNLRFYRGGLFAAQGNHKAAIEEFNKELANNPKSVQTLIALAKEQMAIELPKDALDTLGKAMEADPRSAEAKHLAGYVNYLLKSYSAAIAFYNAAATYDSGNPLIFKRMGVAYLESGNPAAAQEAFRKYLDLDPDAPDRNEILRYR